MKQMVFRKKPKEIEAEPLGLPQPGELGGGADLGFGGDPLGLHQTTNPDPLGMPPPPQPPQAGQAGMQEEIARQVREQLAQPQQQPQQPQQQQAGGADAALQSLADGINNSEDQANTFYSILFELIRRIK